MYRLTFFASDDYAVYLLFLIPVLLFSVIAQIRVKTTFSKYNKVSNARGLTGHDAAELILHTNGLYDVRIERVSGDLTDHYDPKENVIRLSDSVYGSTGIAAVGVAAHEAGHAVQYAENYSPVRVRSAIVGVTRFASGASVWILMLGMLFSFYALARIGFLLYAVVAFFQFVTLPVEFNASRRAVTALEGSNALYGEELSGAKKVLGAAAMTYVAALASALVQLLRLWLMLNGGDRGRRRR